MTDEQSTAYWNALEIADTWSNDAGIVIDALRSGFPDDYATARVLQSEMAFQVGFFGEVPVGALAILATSTVPYFVDENLGFTEIGIDALNTAVGEITSDLVTPGAAWSVGPLPFERTIRVGLALGENNVAGQDTCRSIDPDAIAVAIGDRLAEDGVDTFGFTIDVYTYWGNGVEFQ
ncbi:MAG: hypothetical protein JWQ43_3010 [Glaciihabitans sp.]|nr:hypothetical protein [Glaciihabitans sp.]